jgi:hypothetical protein
MRSFTARVSWVDDADVDDGRRRRRRGLTDIDDPMGVAHLGGAGVNPHRSLAPGDHTEDHDENQCDADEEVGELVARDAHGCSPGWDETKTPACLETRRGDAERRRDQVRT